MVGIIIQKLHAETFYPVIVAFQVDHLGDKGLRTAVNLCCITVLDLQANRLVLLPKGLAVLLLL